MNEEKFEDIKLENINIDEKNFPNQMEEKSLHENNQNNFINESQDITITIEKEEEFPPKKKNQINSPKKNLNKENLEIKKNEDSDIKSIIINKLGVSKSAHPFICIFHILFKILSIIIYLFFGFFLNNIPIFILVSILFVLDFWVVKNISGRFFKKKISLFEMVEG